MPPLADDIVAERFRLVRELGRGAMGAVWLAHHQSLDIPCAVKFIAEQGAAVRELRMRFEREARAAAQIRSPHVVQILDHGLWRDQPYIAMEYLEGETLGVHLLREGRLAPRRVARVVAQIARGLSKAHALGIVHRDLKPDNLFLVHEDGGVIVKILDFGIAKSPSAAGESGSQTRTGALVGTPCYMSPEQADGTKPVDFRSDLWSLGVITYRCVVGQLPFESQAIGDLLMKIMHRPIPIPSRAAPGLPDAFDAWWARASERAPDQRFQSASELSDALSQALGLSAAPSEELASGGPIPLPLADPRATPAAPAEETLTGPLRADESTFDLSQEPAPALGDLSVEQLPSSTAPRRDLSLEATVTLADGLPRAAKGSAATGSTLLASATRKELGPLPLPRAQHHGRIAAALALLVLCAAVVLVRWKQSASPGAGVAPPPLPSSASVSLRPAPPSSATPAPTATSEEATPAASATAAASAAIRAPAPLPSPPKSARPAHGSAKPSAKPPVLTPSAAAPPEKPDLGF